MRTKRRLWKTPSADSAMSTISEKFILKMGCAISLLLLFCLKVIFQCHGVVMCRVVRTEQQRHTALVCGIEDRLPPFGMLIELGPVAPLNFLPPGTIVAEPLPQLGAGGDILQQSSSSNFA